MPLIRKSKEPSYEQKPKSKLIKRAKVIDPRPKNGITPVKGVDYFDGETPTDEQLIELIKPLIPQIENGKDGITPTTDELLALIRPLIPVVQNGETPSDERLLALIKPLLPEYIQLTADDVISDINSKKDILEIKTIKGLSQEIDSRIPKQMIGSPRIKMLNNGQEMSSPLGSLNVIGGTITNKDQDYTLEVTVGGGGIQSIVAGTNMEIDNTDPLNPIANSLSDRYKTTSTTSQAIVSTGTLTFTVDANLAYTPQQDVIIAYDASNHMHGTVVSYSGTSLVVDIQHKIGSGTYASWVINLDGLNTNLAWGTITGTLSAQTDLQTALDAKVDENSPITGATKTKITYDAKGLVTGGADATTADIADSTNKRYVTDADLVVIGNTSGTNTGDQTSIVGISGTKAQFDTALTDGNFLYVGDITQYTDEMAQDAVGSILVDSSEIDFTYDDATPSITATLKAGSIDETKLDASVNASLDLADSAIQNLAGLGITATASELNILDGATLTTTELNYVDGVTSAIQTQLNGKQDLLVSATNIKTINGSSLLGSGDLVVSASAGGSDTQIQFNDSGALGASADFTWNDTDKVLNIGQGTYVPADPSTYIQRGMFASNVSTAYTELTMQGADDAGCLVSFVNNSGVLKARMQTNFGSSELAYYVSMGSSSSVLFNLNGVDALKVRSTGVAINIASALARLHIYDTAEQLRIQNGLHRLSSTLDSSGNFLFDLVPNSGTVNFSFSKAILPSVNGTLAMGSTSFGYTGMFYSTGGVLNFGAGNATLTHSTGLLTSNVDMVVPVEAYGTGWNGSNQVPTKKNIYNEMETRLKGGSEVLTSDVTTSSTTAVSTNLSFAIGASETYTVVVTGTCKKATSATGLKFAISAPAGCTISGEQYGGGATLAAAQVPSLITAINTLGTTLATGINIQVTFRLQFRVTNSTTAGDITLQFATVTSNVATVFAGTRMTYTKATLV